MRAMVIWRQCKGIIPLVTQVHFWAPLLSRLSTDCLVAQLLSSPPSTTSYHSKFWRLLCLQPLHSFLFLCSYPVAYWAPTDLGSSFFSVLSFCLFILFTGFSRQECWSGLPFPSPVDHVLSEFSTWPVHLGWPYNGMAHSFIELDKAVIHVVSLVSFLWLWFSAQLWMSLVVKVKSDSVKNSIA